MTTHSPRVVFCTTCKNRTRHLEQTLPKNLAHNADYPNCKFVVLDYGSQDHLGEFLGTKTDAIKTGRLVVYQFKNDGPFRMAHAKNMAHRCAIREGADILVNLDADNFTRWHFAKYLADQFEGSRESMFMWSRMVQRNDALPRCDVDYRDGKCILPTGHEGQHSTRPLIRGMTGRIAVTKNAFLKVGGYDECFSDWGPDDKDFNLRLTRLGYAGAEIDNDFLWGGIYHDDTIRFTEYPHVEHDQRWYDHVVAVEESSKTIVNFGNCGCGVVFRNFDPTPITLAPIPTRIFGVGWHKTATTSLYHALEVLGFDSAHWKTNDWARDIWNEVSGTGTSRTLERSYAISDMPIGLLYQKLDGAYPGSKFILTIRDESDWFESARNHWSYEKNPYRWEWDVYPFSNHIHTAMYGQKSFDAEIMLSRYRRHNSEVMAYFKDRPGDLLVMDMSKGDGWAPLCEFLGASIPRESYPRSFATAMPCDYQI